MIKKEIFADLHIHSRFSRATSKDLNIENLNKWAKIKGINLLGTGDFTHPEWLKELKNNLTEKNNLFTYKGQEVQFMLTSELSFMFTKDIKGRRIHLLIFAPNFKVVDEINKYLDTKGRRDYDGRPIFGISCEEFVKDISTISEDIEIIPAHIWTPWFGVFGSRGGFNSLKQAFGSQVEKIHAIETGISSDPYMNLKIKELENLSIVSFSDAHSFWPWRLGREATIFYKLDEDNYKNIINQIRQNTFKGTIEVDPGYGKYHFDGHRNCNFSCKPKETIKLNGICPICKKPLTKGVEYRVEELEREQKPDKNNSISIFSTEPIKEPKPFYSILPLHEIIAFSEKTSLNSKKTWEIYNKLIKEFKTEFNILLNIEKTEFKKIDYISENLINLIIQNRIGNIKVNPGYDGVYGTINLIQKSNQKTLF